MRAFVVASALGLCVIGVARAQESAKPADGTKELEVLDWFVGEWDSVADEQPGVNAKGKAKARKIGDLWVAMDLEIDMNGAKVSAVQMIGYDEKTKKYVGTWVDSMMNKLWTYGGKLEADGKTITMEADGPSMTDESKTAKYRDVYEFKSKDHYVLTSSIQGEDGAWTAFMTAQVRRKK